MKKKFSDFHVYVLGFMQLRKGQRKGLGKKITMSLNGQIGRFNHICDFMRTNMDGVKDLNKSEIFDFLMFLFEDYLASKFKSYESFNSKYDRLNTAGVGENVEKVYCVEDNDEMGNYSN